MSAMSDFFADKPGWAPLQGTFTECWGNGCMCVETRCDRHGTVRYRACVLYDDRNAPRIKDMDRPTVAEAYADALVFAERYTGGAP